MIDRMTTEFKTSITSTNWKALIYQINEYGEIMPDPRDNRRCPSCLSSLAARHRDTQYCSDKCKNKTAINQLLTK